MIAPVSIAIQPRRRLYLPYILLLALVLAWSAAWLVGRGMVERRVDAWLGEETAAGRQWTCPDRRIGGYPFRITLSCDGPTLQRADGVTASLAGFRSVAQVYQPNHIITDLRSPLVLKGTGNAELELAWDTAQTSIRRSGEAVSRGSVVLTMPRVTVRSPGFEPFVNGGERLEAHLREAPAGAEPGRYDVALKLTGTTLPMLDRMARSNDKLDLLLDLSTRNLPTTAAPDWRLALEAWRAASGLLKVETLQINKGNFRLTGKGDLSLDAERRLAGRIDLEVQGAEQLLQGAGLMPRGALGGLLGGVLGGNGRSARLPLVLENGRAQIGPFPLGPLRPLYTP
jgi:hypothetical protein